MRSAYWRGVVAAGCQVPDATGVAELTTELVGMLGSPDPRVRDELALTVLRTWVAAGVHDDLLGGLGDGLVVGLRTGLGEAGTPTVFRRTRSASVLAAVVGRDTATQLVHPRQLLGWADRGIDWFLAERDLRGPVAGAGRAAAVAHGAGLLAELATSRHLGADELAVLLDVLVDRLLTLGDAGLLPGDDDRLALVVMAALRRELLTLDRLEAWVHRLAAACRSGRADAGPAIVALVRALHLQLLLGGRGAAAPTLRSDLLLALQDVIRGSAPEAFGPRG